MSMRLFMVFIIFHMTWSQVNSLGEGDDGVPDEWQKRRRKRTTVNHGKKVSSSSSTASTSNSGEPMFDHSFPILDTSRDVLGKYYDPNFTSGSASGYSNKFAQSSYSNEHDINPNFALKETQMAADAHNVDDPELEWKAAQNLENQYNLEDEFDEDMSNFLRQILFDEPEKEQGEFLNENIHDEIEEQNNSAEPASEDMSQHTFIFSNEGILKKCFDCYHKNSEWRERRKKSRFVRTKCAECNMDSCPECFQDRHKLDVPPTLTPAPPATDQICFFCKENIGNEENELIHHTKSCEKIKCCKNENFGCYKEGCPYSNNRSDCIRTHIRIHTGYLPFLCPFCYYANKEQRHLVRHMRRRH